MRASGARFEDAYAPTSTTAPTHATLFTGLHPWEHGVPRNGRVLADEHVTLAERLAKTAYLYPKHVEVIDDFAQAVLDGKEPSTTGPEARRSLALVLAIYESARSGREIVLNHPPTF